MLGGRPKLPVLAEISGPPEPARVWSLRREDLASLAEVQSRLAERRAVLVSGREDLARTVAIAASAAAASSGRRTVLVDCDLEAPRLAADLGLAPGPGVHEYLRWEAEARQLPQPLALAGPAAAGARGPLVFIAAGRPAADPTALLGLPGFRHMAEKLRHAYDLVVLLGPSAGPRPGPLVTIAAEAECVLAALPPAQASGRGGRAARVGIGRLPVSAIGAVVVGGA